MLRRLISLEQIATLAFFLFLCSMIPAQQQRSMALKVRVLNGKSGIAVSHARIIIFGGLSQEDVRLHSTEYDGQTDKAGLAVINLQDRTKFVQVWVDGYILCQDRPNFKSYGMTKISAGGVSAPNTCGKLTVDNSPGIFVVYARKPSIRERMRE